MARRNTRRLRQIPWAVRHAMPRLGFQRRRDGSFVYFPGPFALTGAYEVPDADLEDTARAAFARRRRSRSLYGLVMAACVLLGAFAAYPVSVEISAAFDADRASVERALRLASLGAGLLVVALLVRVRQRRFAIAHLQGFAFSADEERAVLFRPRASYGASDIRWTGIGGCAAAAVGWGLHLLGFPDAYAEGGFWALVVEAQILLLLAPALAYCLFLLRHAERVRRPRVAHADASELWAELEIASGRQRRKLKREPRPRPLIWRLLFPGFGSGHLARQLEKLWFVMIWSLLLTILGLLLLLDAGRL